MNFQHPQGGLLFPAVIAVLALVLLTFRWKDRTAQALAAGSSALLLITAASRPRQALKAFLVLLALTATVIAIIGPYLGEQPKPVRPQSADVVLLLDVSLSMAAQDITPSRFQAAKDAGLSLIDRLDGDRVGLVVFGGSAALRAPMTYDYDAAKGLLRSVELDSAPTPGSALAEGARTAYLALRQSEAATKAVIVFSDGEDLGQGLEAVAAELGAQNITFHTIGFGTPQGGPIPVPGPIGFKRDGAGQVVQTRLGEQSLQALAQATNGTYARATNGSREALQAYQSLRAKPLEQPQDAPRPANELAPYFLLLAFLLLLVELLISERRSAKAPVRGFALAPLGLLVAVACSSGESHVFDLNQMGLEQYQAKEFNQALNAFRRAQVERPDLPEFSFNVGGTLYKTEQYERSLRELQRSLLSGDGQLQAKAHFNMGNALFQLGRFQDAAEEYKRTLRQTPDDIDAKINLELALHQIRPPQPPGQTPNQPDPNNPQQNQPPQPPQNRDPQQQPGDPQGRPGQTPQGPPQDPNEALKQALREAGDEYSIDEVLRILDALRDRERQFQGQYNQRPASPGGPRRPDKDW